MSKKIKIIITSVLCLIIIGIGTFLIYNNHSDLGKQKSKEFIKSINYIKDENYIEAYNTIKNSDKEEIDIIQTIILYKFCDQMSAHTKVINEIAEEVDHIRDYLTYPYLYSKDSSYQRKINKIYDTEYSKLYEIRTKIPESIMFDDSVNFYNKYFEVLDLGNGAFKNYEYNIIHNQEKNLAKVNKIETKLNEMKEEYEKVVGIHPESEIPEEYSYLLFDIE